MDKIVTGKEIKYIREALNMTVTDFGKRVGVTRPTVYKIENETGMVTLKHAKMFTNFVITELKTEQNIQYLKTKREELEHELEQINTVLDLWEES